MIEKLIVRLIGDGTSYMRMMKDASNITRQFGITVTQIGRSISRLGRNLTLFLTAPIIALGVSSLTASVRMETMLIRLQALVGSAKKGAEQFEKIKKFSIPSPFLLQDLLGINNLLVGFGMSADEAFKSLEMLSDVASLTSNNFRRLALAYGQAFADQRVMGRDINQFVNSSVPLLKMLEDTIGLTGKEIRKMSSEGELSFELLENAMIAATAAGGQFHRGTAVLAETTQGKMSQLADRVMLVKAAFGDLLKESFVPFLEKVLAIAEKLEDMDDGMRRQIISAFKLAAIIGPLVIVLGAGVIFLGHSVTLIGTLTSGLVGLGLAATAALSPYSTLAALIVGGAVAGTAATTAMKTGGEKKGFAGFLDSLDLIRERLITIWRIGAKAFALIFGVVGREFTWNLGKNLIKAFNGIAPLVVRIFEIIVEQVNSVITGRVSGVSLFQALKEVADEYSKGFGGRFDKGVGFEGIPREMKRIVAEETANEAIRRGSNTPDAAFVKRVEKLQGDRDFLFKNAREIALETIGVISKKPGFPDPNVERWERIIKSRSRGGDPFSPRERNFLINSITDPNRPKMGDLQIQPPTAAEFLGGIGEAAAKELVTIAKETKTLLEDVLKRPLIVETEPARID